MVWGWLAVGLLFGLTDATAAQRLLGADVDRIRFLLFLCAGTVGGLGFAAVGAVAMRLLGADRSPWTGFVGGAAGLLAADLAVLRLGGLVGVGLGLVLAVGVGWLGRTMGADDSRRRMLLSLGLIALLAIRSSPGRVERADPVSVNPAEDGSPDVIVVTVDGLPAAPPAGLQPDPMPNLRRLMAQGTRYTRAFTPDASWRGGHRAVLEGRVPWAEDAEGISLARALRHGGWTTLALPATQDIAADPVLVRSFDEVRVPGWPVPGLESTLLGAALRHWFPPELAAPRAGASAMAQGLRWLRTTDGPSLLWVHISAPRAPFLPPPPWDEAWYEGDRYAPGHLGPPPDQVPPDHAGITDPDWYRAAWIGELAVVDEALGHLMAELDSMEPAPLLVVAGTAGMPMGAEGRWFVPDGTTSPPASHVPLVLRWPGHVPAGVEIGAPVSLVDVGATVCNLVLPPGSCPPAGRALPRLSPAAGVRSSASTRGTDGNATWHDTLDSWRMTAAGARERWSGGRWVAVDDGPGTP